MAGTVLPKLRRGQVAAVLTMEPDGDANRSQMLPDNSVCDIWGESQGWARCGILDETLSGMLEMGSGV